MIYVGTWNDEPIAYTSKKKDLEFYLKDIRHIPKEEYEIYELEEESSSYTSFMHNMVSSGLYMVDYYGVRIPEWILTVIPYDLRLWRERVSMLFMELASFTRLMYNGNIIEDIKPLTEVLCILDDTISNSDKIFSKLENDEALSHPILTCGFNEYLEYRETYFTMLTFGKNYEEYSNMLDLDYT